MPRLLSRLVLIACLLAPTAARAEDAAIVVTQAWARPTLKGTHTGAAYLTLINRGTAPDRLLGVSTPVAERSEIHEDVMKDGVMSMRPVAALTLAPGTTTALEPGRYHVMLMGVREPLKAGGSFPLTLTFENAGALEVMVAIGASPPKAGSPTR